jgi:parvulin-like peptidyl-prolyl isomerase
MGNFSPSHCLEGHLLVIRTPRRLALLAAAGLAVVLALSGCGNEPVRAGAAATVGDVRITTAELHDLVTRGLADPQAEQQLGADKAAFQRLALGRLIQHEIVTKAAEEEGVKVTDGAVDARIAEFERQAGGAQQLEQTAAQNGVAKQDLRRFIQDIVVNEALGDKLTADIEVPQAQLQAAFQQNAAQNDQVHAAHILVADKATADDLLAQVEADPSKFAALAAKYSTDTSNKDKGGDLGFAGRGAFVKVFEDAVFGAKPGDFFVVKSEFGYHVVHVIDRRTTTLAQALPELRRQILQQEREQRTNALLAKVAKELGVKVNPRFGRWDSTQGQVEAVPVDGNSVSSPVPSPGADDTGNAGNGAPGGAAPSQPPAG